MSFQAADLGSVPDSGTIFFIQVWKMHQIPGFSWRQTFGNTFLCTQSKHKNLSWQFSKKTVALLGTRTRDLSLLNKSQNYCSTLSTTLLRYQQLVMNFQPSEKTDVCRPLPPFCFFPRGKYISWCSVHHSGTSDDDKCTL